MIKHVSTRAALLVLCAGLAAGCVDAKKRLLDFDDRVGTADGGGNVGPGNPDANISGRFYLAIDPSLDPNPDHLVHYIVTVVMPPDNATVDVTLTPLDFETRLEIPGEQGDAFERLASNGTFRIELVNVVIPARANSVLQGSTSVTITDGEFLSTIVDEGLWCGIINGNTNLGSNLDNSTFGAVRVGDDDIGDALPAPTIACPDENNADAGVPDAAPDAPPDAGADAPAGDAML